MHVKTIWAFITIAVVTVALAARLVSIGYNFDGDEIFSLKLISGSWSEIIYRSLADKPHPPLHNLLLHGWVDLWGTSETKLRSLSVLLSIVAILISMDIFKQRGSAFGALAAGLTLAISGFFAYYSQEARPYSLIFAAGAFNIWSFLKLFADPNSRYNAILWAASAAVMVWSQYIGAIYLAVEGCLLLLRFPLRLALRAILPALLAGGTILPWMWLAFTGNSGFHELGWISPPSSRELPYLYLGAIGWPPVISGWFLLASIVVLILFGAYRIFLATQHPWDELALAAIAVVPVVAVFGLSHLSMISIWAPRQLILSALAFILLLFILVDSFPRPFRLAAQCMLVIWAMVGFVDALQWNRVPHWRVIVNRIENINPHAVILANETWTLNPLRYYARESGLRIIDARANKLNLPKGTLFAVCRRFQQADPCDQLLKQSSHHTIELARDPWSTFGGEPREIIFTYRIEPRTMIRQKSQAL